MMNVIKCNDDDDDDDAMMTCRGSYRFPMLGRTTTDDQSTGQPPACGAHLGDEELDGGDGANGSPKHGREKKKQRK